MINEKIKYFRKSKGITQEEMAVKLNVVRQTVSKWENGLSVPDADVLIKIAELLDVPVSKLLGIEEIADIDVDLSEELTKLNEELAQKNQREKLVKQANKKRGLIITLSFVAMLITILVKDEFVSILLASVCMLTAVIVLYRNLALLTSITTDDLKMGILSLTTFFNIGIFVVGVFFAVLLSLDVLTLSENGEKLLTMALISCVIIFSGIISPMLPFNKHTGLRLPWTVQDEDTWNIAHRTLGYISLPIALLYIACTLTIPNFDIVTICVLIAWIGTPSVISYIYYMKKMYGK